MYERFDKICLCVVFGPALLPKEQRHTVLCRFVLVRLVDFFLTAARLQIKEKEGGEVSKASGGRRPWRRVVRPQS